MLFSDVIQTRWSPRITIEEYTIILQFHMNPILQDMIYTMQVEIIYHRSQEPLKIYISNFALMFLRELSLCETKLLTKFIAS